VKLNRVGTGGVGTTRRGRVRADFTYAAIGTRQPHAGVLSRRHDEWFGT
jgi:hypothetical protein